MSSEYRVRVASAADTATLVRHRLAMFSDMGVPFDEAELDGAFRAWLGRMLPAGVYRAWLAETAAGDIAGGGGFTILPWPPGPRYTGDRLAYVYNVYTEPPHRRRGVARLIMDAIHLWCQEEGIGSVALNASRDGQPLYQSLGYSESPSPMMFLPIVRV